MSHMRWEIGAREVFIATAKAAAPFGGARPNKVRNSTLPPDSMTPAPGGQENVRVMF